MSKACSPTKRRDMDIMKLMMSDYEVEHLEEAKADFCVTFKGPKDTAYEDGTWRVRVELPLDYPYRSPSIGFMNRLYHPNVDEISGSVCLDVINQTWSPMFDLVNIFDVFLPQLLRYPNPSDPLNAEAASLMLEQPKLYAQKVKDMVVKHAQPKAKECKSDIEDGDMDMDDLSSLSGASECDPGDFEMD